MPDLISTTHGTNFRLMAKHFVKRNANQTNGSRFTEEEIYEFMKAAYATGWQDEQLRVSKLPPETISSLIKLELKMWAVVAFYIPLIGLEWITQKWRELKDKVK